MNINEQENTVIRVQASLVHVIYPKFPKVVGTPGNEWGNTIWKVNRVDSGNVKYENNNNTTIKVVGDNFDEPIMTDKNYIILAKEGWSEKYGFQYDLVSINEEIDFSKIENQEAFLKVFCTDGQIKEMYEILGNPLEAISNHDIESLTKVKGIGEYTANRIIERFEKHKDNSKVYIELADYNLTPVLIAKLVKHYDKVSKVIDIVKNKPYELIGVSGIGFRKADEIALKTGIDPKSTTRIKAFISYLLDEQGQNGNSYLYSNELTMEIFNEMGGKENILEVYKDENGNVINNNVGLAIQEMVDDGEIVLEDNENRAMRKIYLKKYYVLEEQICGHLKRLLNSHNNFKFGGWEDVLKEQEGKQGWEFTEEQKRGIELGLNEQVCFITGGAGTGKSSLVAGILSVLKNYSFAQCSLSGKAAARLKEVTGEDGYTIHRLLQYTPKGFTFNSFNPLNYDIIIVDELSLIGGEIFLSLLKAIPNGTKLILLGDMGQLESIGSMNLASDIYHSRLIPTQELTKIHRQAQKSGIITSSYAIRNGKEIFEKRFSGQDVIGELEDMILDIAISKDEIKDTAIEYFNEYYTNELVKEDIMNIQLISPVKERGESCVFNLNLAIQEIINPEDFFKRQVMVKAGKDKYYYLRENDKVICTTNNYDMSTVEGNKVDIFNGWMGKIVSIDLISETAEVYFPLINETVKFATLKDLINNVTLGYAITCHKMQGASAKVIIGVVDFSTPPAMLTKELLYTMITRAEKLCILVGQNRAISTAIQNSGISHKKTFLKEMLDGDFVTENNLQKFKKEELIKEDFWRD